MNNQDLILCDLKEIVLILIIHDKINNQYLFFSQ